MSSSLKRKANGRVDADSIRVICRFRPPKKSEIELHGQSSQLENFVISEALATVEVTGESLDKKNFAFDKIFGTSTSQSQVFEEVKDVIRFVMEGFNGTILAYGQTSSGKTHTMEGPNLRDLNDQGLIPRLIDCLFHSIVTADKNTRFTVSVTYFEIYCEKLRDLLNPALDNLKIREKSDGDVIIEDVTEVYCTDKEGVMRVIEMGKAHRASAPTLMNAESSRSHSLLSIQVEQKDESTGRNRKGKLFLVDLAGSEKVSKTGAKGVRLEEAKNINKSLTTLGMVINSLCDGLSHIPYRDSKLTRVLTESLGGNSKTTLVICCAPEGRHLSETISTLRFGERAKRIKNKAKVNEELSVGELKLLLSAMRLEVSALKAQLSANGVASASSSSEPEEDVSSGTLRERLLLMVSAPRPMPVSREEVQSLLDTHEELEEEVRGQANTIQELTDELQKAKETISSEKSSRLQQSAEIASLKASISELEKRFLEAKLSNQPFGSLTRRSSRMEGDVIPVKKTEDASQIDFVSSLSSELDRPSDVPITNTPVTNGLSTPTRRLSTVDSPRSPGTATSPSLLSPVRRMSESSGMLRSPDSIAVDFAPPPAERVDAEPLQPMSSADAYGSEGAEDGLYSLEAENASLLSQLEVQTRSRVSLEEDVRSLQRVASEQAEQYVRLREEYELHVQRLMMKLSHEQHARSEVEDQLEALKQRLWKRTETSGIPTGLRSSPSRRDSSDSTLETRSDAGSTMHDQESFEDMDGTGAKPKRPSADKRRKTLLSMFGEGAKSAKDKLTDASHAIANTLPMPSALGVGVGMGNRPYSVQRERDLARQVTELETRISHLHAEMGATEQLHRMLVETKEVITRSLFEQNASITQERDALSAKVDVLNETVDQLRRSLDAVQRLNLRQLMGDSEAGAEDDDGVGPISRTVSRMASTSSLRARTRSASTVKVNTQPRHIQGGGAVTMEPASIHGQGTGTKLEKA